MRDFNLVTIRLFVAVAQLGSFAAAARREHIAASAISYRINELELATGTKLFRRMPRGVELTEAGRVFLDRSQAILAQLRDLEQDLKPYSQGHSGNVRVAAVTTAITGKLAKLLKTFTDQYPDIHVDLIELYSPEALDAVRSGESDLALVTDIKSRTGLESCHFGTDPVWVIGPRGHPLFDGRAAGASVPFSEAVKYRVISLHEGGVLDELVLKAARKSDATIKRAFRVSRFDSLRRLVEEGMGIGFLRESNIRPFLKAYALQAAPIADGWAQRDLEIVWLRGATLDPAVRQFVEFLKSKV